jgi:gliding motility-associated-like protein
LIHMAGREQVDYVYPDTIMNISPVSFRIASTNGCRERIESDIHTTILLEGIADSARNAMTLSWTPYVGWSDKVDAYELWYRVDGNQYARAATFLPDERRWSNSWGANGFEHDYRIRAIHTDGRTESWSNEVRLSFHNTLIIPNVFTPNSDGVNDTFTFPKLEIFHENDLLVFDRNGKEVFSRKDYDGSWDGNGFASGVYYYSFTEKRYGTTYKGWLQILR